MVASIQGDPPLGGCLKGKESNIQDCSVLDEADEGSNRD